MNGEDRDEDGSANMHVSTSHTHVFSAWFHLCRVLNGQDIADLLGKGTPDEDKHSAHTA